MDQGVLKKPEKLWTYTFGCKVNQADTAYLENSLAQSTGCEVNQDTPPDTILINTCTVTASADRQARRLIRRLHRMYPESKVVVTGCYAQAKPHEVSQLEGVHTVLPLAGQRAFVERWGGAPLSGAFFPQTKKTRLNLKLQDGCNAYCSFCILPYVRGRSRSIDPELLEAAARDAREKFHEIVLTGTHLAGYGRDLSPRLRLSDIVRRILAAAPGMFARISSLEPTGLTPDFIRLVSQEKRIRPHFHIPLQSASAKVLRRMNRKYTAKNFHDRILALHAASRDPMIGTDVIVGFPGETAADFEETYRFLEALPLTQIHVFPYSPREGTRASAWEDDVPFAEKKARVHRLMALSRRKKLDFLSAFVGRVEPVLVELHEDAQGRLKGHNPHHALVHFAGPARLKQREVEVRCTSVENADEPYLVGQVA